MIAFRRSTGLDNLLVIASLNNQHFGDYAIQTESWRLPDGAWREMFNSNASAYGGDNFGNGGRDLQVTNGRVVVSVPANGLVILARS